MEEDWSKSPPSTLMPFQSIWHNVCLVKSEPIILPFKPPLALCVPAYMILLLPQAPTSFLYLLLACVPASQSFPWFFQTHHCLPCLRPLLLRFLLCTKFYFSLADSNLFFSSLFKSHFLKETLPNPLIRPDILVM